MSPKAQYIIQIALIFGALTIALLIITVGDIEPPARSTILLAGVAIGACFALVSNFVFERKRRNEHHDSQEDAGDSSGRSLS